MEPRLAGEIIAAGGIQRAILSWRREGTGSAGWEAAKGRLAVDFPAATDQTLEAVIDRAKAVVPVGGRYMRGNPDYVPPGNTIPDVRRLEYYADLGICGHAHNRPDPRFYYVGTVDVIATEGGREFTITRSVTFHADSLLNRDEVEWRLNQAAEPLRNFASTSPDIKAPPPLQQPVRIEGAFKGC